MRCGATGPLPIIAYAQDKGDKLCLDAAATVHKVLIKIPATNPFQYKYTDFQPKVYLRAKSQTLLVVRPLFCTRCHPPTAGPPAADGGGLPFSDATSASCRTCMP